MSGQEFLLAETTTVVTDTFGSRQQARSLRPVNRTPDTNALADQQYTKPRVGNRTSIIVRDSDHALNEFSGFWNRMHSFVRTRESCGSIGRFSLWLAVRVRPVAECRELLAAQS